MERKEEISRYVQSLKVCAKKKDLNRGTFLHADIRGKGLLGKSSHLATALIDMYAKCGLLAKAQDVLEELPVRGLVSWNALIAGYVHQGLGHEALHCFERMQSEGLSPNVVTSTCILKACATVGALDTGKRIHEDVVNMGLLEKDIFLANALIDMYAKCGMLEKAQEVLKKLPVRNTVTWSALIAGYAQQGQGHEALSCFEWMQSEGLPADVVTFTCILKACAMTGSIDKGKQIHEEIVNKGLLKKDMVLGNALVDMYAKCGALEKAEEVLRELPVHDVISWSALIAGYTQRQQGHEALKCFEQMQNEGLSPDGVTLTSMLKACATTGSIEKGKQIHVEIVLKGLLRQDVVVGNALVDMYAKCGALADAQNVLDGIPIRNVVSWSALIGGYAQQERGHEALNCFEKMKNEGFYPDAVTFVGILKACSSTGAIDKGKCIHEEIVNKGLLEKDITLGNALVDMYAKFGMLAKAKEVFTKLSFQDTVSWNALISGYAQQGEGRAALCSFKEMKSRGIAPDKVTFLSVLSACTHSGLLDDAQVIFTSMKNYGIVPNLEHHTCMVAVFGCAGNFDDAMSIIKVMPLSDDIAVWIALLGACRKWENVKLGRLVFDQVIQLDDSSCAAYVLMTNIFAAAGLQKDAEKIEAMKMKHAACKKQGEYVGVDLSGGVWLHMPGTFKARICVER